MLVPLSVPRLGSSRPPVSSNFQFAPAPQGTGVGRPDPSSLRGRSDDVRRDLRAGTIDWSAIK